MAYTVQEFFAYMDSPDYKAKIEADRRAREAAEDDYFDKLGELVERHPIGRPLSRSSLIRAFNQPEATAAAPVQTRTPGKPTNTP